MPVEVACACGKSFRVPDRAAGKRVKCPACSQPVAVPSAAAASGATESIRATCSCGRAISVKSELAGKAVKCPDCGQPVKIPGATTAAGRKASLAASGDDGLVGLMDEVDLRASSTGRRCPDCRSDMQPDDILCVKCGYNTETGRRLGTRRTGRKEEGRRPTGRFQAKAGNKGKHAAILKVLGLLLLLGVVAYLVMRQMGKLP